MLSSSCCYSVLPFLFRHLLLTQISFIQNIHRTATSLGLNFYYLLLLEFNVLLLLWYVDSLNKELTKKTVNNDLIVRFAAARIEELS